MKSNRFVAFFKPNPTSSSHSNQTTKKSLEDKKKEYMREAPETTSITPIGNIIRADGKEMLLMPLPLISVCI